MVGGQTNCEFLGNEKKEKRQLSCERGRYSITLSEPDVLPLWSGGSFDIFVDQIWTFMSN